MHNTLPLLQATDFPPLQRGRLITLQVNLGYRCNQSCLHCHVNAGPNRTEAMDDANVELIPRVLSARGLATLDLTGGAPELHPRFRWLVMQARKLGIKVIDRCNLSILSDRGRKTWPTSSPPKASRSWPRCPATWRKTWTDSAARACSNAASPGSSNSTPWVIFLPGPEGHDINDEEDWEYAEYLIQTGKAKLPEVKG